MKTRSRVQKFMFSAALLASPALATSCGIVFAVEETRLQPVQSGHQLKSVPEPAAAVTVQPKARLSGVQGQSATQQAVASATVEQRVSVVTRPDSTVPSAASKVVQVQHSQTVEQSTNTRRSDRTENQRRKPGIFRRLFGADDVEPVRPVGEPAPPIPTPPPLVYNTQSNSAVANSGGNLRARAAGYQQPGTNFQEVGQQKNLSNDPAADVATEQSRQYGKRSTQSDGFINPFTTVADTVEADALLDLDSLIETEAFVEKKTPQAEPAPKHVVTVEADMVPSAKGESENPTSIEQTQPAGPYTGFRLENGPALYGTTEIKAQRKVEPSLQVDSVSSDALVEQPASAVELPSASEEASVANPGSGFEEIPLLGEPEIKTPVAETNQQSSTATLEIPLLKEDEVAQPVPDTAEPLVETPAAEEESQEISDAQRMRFQESKAQRDQQLYRIMARTGQKGFKGFCPVELRDNRQLVDSRSQYKAKFGLQSYYFSSPEAKSAFEANPARYAPAAGGSDVVLLVNTGEEVAGTLDFTLWYRDRLYMFRSRETVEIFSSDPTRYANQY